MAVYIRVKRARPDPADPTDAWPVQPPKRVYLEDGQFRGVFEYTERVNPALLRPLSRVSGLEHLGELVTDSAAAEQPEGGVDQEEYSYYAPATSEPQHSDYPVLTVVPDLLDDDYDTSADSQDSNCENYYTHDYPEDDDYESD